MKRPCHRFRGGAGAAEAEATPILPPQSSVSPHHLGAVAEPKDGGEEDCGSEGLNKGIEGVTDEMGGAVNEGLGKDVERVPKERAAEIGREGAAAKEG